MIFQSLREGHLDPPVFMYLTFFLVNLVGSLQLQEGTEEEGLSTLFPKLLDANVNVQDLREVLKEIYEEHGGDFKTMPSQTLLAFGAQLVELQNSVKTFAKYSEKVTHCLIPNADL